MNAERIDVFDEADRDHVALGVADNFELELFPAENGFLNKNLSNDGCLKTTCDNCL